MTDKTDNLALWNRFADVDPKFTKAITGKPYKGTSPSPQYVIQCLTEMFGPVGQGFGWRVLVEEFTPLGNEVLHWCRIEFWHTDRANTFESYGQTKAYYATKAGGVVVDEDAPKKSLTDAIIKAASQVGIASNIFLGRWDDQKYVAEVTETFREKVEYDPAPDVAKIEAAMSGRDLLPVLKALGDRNTHDAIIAARRDKIEQLVKGAPSLEALTAMSQAFATDWDHMADADAARRDELRPRDAVDADEIPM